MSPELLYFVDYDNPILKKKTQPVQFPLNQEDRHIIASMKYSIQPAQLQAAKAPWDAAVGMAANQWGIDKSIFLYCPTGDTVNHLEVIINPSYYVITPTSTHNQMWEGCFSVPLSAGSIDRDTHIKVKYQNEEGQIIEKVLIGWEARVWQHEYDHLNGYLYDDPRHGKCIEKKVFRNYQEVEDFYLKIREERSR